MLWIENCQCPETKATLFVLYYNYACCEFPTSLNILVSMHWTMYGTIAFRRKLTNDEAQGLSLAMTLAPGEHVLNLGALLDVLPTCTLPGYERTRVGREITLGKDVVRDVRQTLTLEVGQVKTDALGRGVRVYGVHVFVVDPDGLGHVRCINTFVKIQHAPLRRIQKTRHVPTIRCREVSGVLPAPRASRSWTVLLDFRRRAEQSSHQVTERHLGSTKPCWKT